MNNATPYSNAARGRWVVDGTWNVDDPRVGVELLSASNPGGPNRLGDWGLCDVGVCGFLGVSPDRSIGRTIRRTRDRSARRARCAGAVACNVGHRARFVSARQGSNRSVGAWAILGVGMALGLYDAGFAALTAIYGDEARGPITGITLFGGFSSTVSWPLSTVLNDAVGWRETCLAWAALNLLIGLPLNRFVFPMQVHRVSHREESEGRIGWRPYREMLLLAFVFAAGWFVTAAMAAHLPTLLERAGVTRFQAVAAAALFGPAQVAARIAELVVLRKIHPVVSSRIAASLHPIGAVILVVVGPPAAVVFVFLHGAGNGLLTIAQGTVPLAIFGRHGYGAHRAAWCSARAAQAFAPLLFGLLMDRMGLSVLFVSASLYIAALAALMCVRVAR